MLIPNNIKMPAIYEQDGKGDDAIVYIKIVHHGGTWLITEYDPSSKTAFGYVLLSAMPGMAELGYISIEELESIPLMERVENFEPKTLRECKADLKEQYDL